MPYTKAFVTRGDGQTKSQYDIEVISSSSSHTTDSVPEESDGVCDEDEEWQENIKEVRRHLHF